jgi:dihydropteroate synthase
VAETTVTALLAVANDTGEARRALAEGADLLDVSGCEPGAAAAIRAAHPGAVPAGSTAQASTAIGPGAVIDADLLAAACAGLAGPHPPGAAGADAGGEAAGEAPVAAVIAVAAIGTWLGAAAVRTRHVREVRRVIDMTSSIAGIRPPALTTRGLA